jgi:hypothetical protein
MEEGILRQLAHCMRKEKREKRGEKLLLLI